MEFGTVSGSEFGKSLSGIGLNLLTRDVLKLADFLQSVFDMKAPRLSKDFAIILYGNQVFQLHSDPTFAAHPLHALLPEAGARGAGIEIRLYNTDPDQAVRRAIEFGESTTILQHPKNKKPHGLRECTILCADGYAWVPSRHLRSDEES